MQYVHVRVHDEIATITMDRANKRNALNPQLIEDLSTAISDVHQEKRVKAVVLTGAGEHFSAGIDLQVLGKICELPDHDAVGEWFRAWQQLAELLEKLLRLPKPVIAAVDGTAAGAGFGLALASDMIVVSNKAYLAANAVHHGLVGGATTALLAFRCGSSVASRLVLTGESINAEEAYRLGLSKTPVASEQIWVAAIELAKAAAVGPREAIQANKRVLNESVGEQLMSQITACAADSATACTTESAAEGIRAFIEKRDARWPS